MKNNQTLGELMRTMKVELTLINDYSDGRDNGKTKVVECLLSDINNIEEIKKYIEEKFELNLDDMWQITDVKYN